MKKISGIWAVLAGLIFLAGCGTDPSTGPPNTGDLLDPLLAPSAAAEIAAVITELEGRTYPAGTLQFLETRSGTFADLSLVAYESAGHTIYGVLSQPKAAGTYPLVLYNHGGDNGMSATELDHPLAAGFVQAASSFRSEAVRWFGTDYQSEGTPSPWDRDVDDALVLLASAIQLPNVDPSRVWTVGGSRGGGVSLLAAIRLPDRFLGVVDVFGPTDFFDPAFRPAVDTLAAGGTDGRPGTEFLKETVLLPYLSGALSLAEGRQAMIRRSAMYFADRLPPVQVHHGTADNVVPISQSERLVARLRELGKPVEYYAYPGMGHEDVLGPEQIPRILAFVK